jgi:hypothetical protein
MIPLRNASFRICIKRVGWVAFMKSFLSAFLMAGALLFQLFVFAMGNGVSSGNTA